MPEGGLLTIETANLDLDETYAQRHVEAARRRLGARLATVYGIVQQAGGHVEIYSEIDGRRHPGR
jgi:hypothetical protein